MVVASRSELAWRLGLNFGLGRTREKGIGLVLSAKGGAESDYWLDDGELSAETSLGKVEVESFRR